MNIRDLFFLVHCVGMQRKGQRTCVPQKGYATAAVRLEKANLIARDPTVTRKPYGYIPTDKGYKVVNSAVRLMELAR